ncbi:hypothetical protein GWG65_34900 [Bradyrhizobium sp. CSA207]|uniref:hypothetical protein n=1 Tax=Bradyrhizobium sp. CSA207 TaxID=2698826 RepID=UPI0023B04FED|nr:hypothetical protein [Bradyrhizobium sp. CSA207]MDE5446462.1 hypothetical protein [Bradyrhizobium sp. CSA207]
MLLMATTAQAATVLQKSGAWQTYITKNSDGKPMCGMLVLGRGSSLMVKYSSGGEIFIQIYKDGWSIPHGTEIPGYLTFDNSQRFPALRFGSMHKDGTGYVEFTIKAGTEADFIDLSKTARKMVVGFDQGTQLPFEVNMQGSRAAASMFGRCATSIDQIAADAPQPFANAAAVRQQTDAGQEAGHGWGRWLDLTLLCACTHSAFLSTARGARSLWH